MAETHELGGSAVVVDRATPKASYSTPSLFSFCCTFYPSSKKKVLFFFPIYGFFSKHYIFLFQLCDMIYFRKMTSGQWAERHRVDMVHTMLIFLQQLDMQPLVLLLYMIIPAQFMGVSTFETICQVYAININMHSFFPHYVELGGESSRGMGKKIFVGRLPQEASSEDLRQYFGRFGRILDVYVPRVR